MTRESECPEPHRKGHHEMYARPDGTYFCRACGEEFPKPEPREKKNCRGCVHYSLESESYEMPEYRWHECGARPGMANLNSFPFLGTKCCYWISNKGTRNDQH
jgi:hypothetical protein